MDSLYNPKDATKIGVLLTGFGGFFFFLGIMMFLDSSMLTLGNILFVAGVALTMGPHRCKAFFLEKKRMRSSICFFVGILLVMVGWCFFGLIIQMFGALNLFGNFFPLAVRLLESLPLIGPIMCTQPIQKLVAYVEGRDTKRNV